MTYKEHYRKGWRPIAKDTYNPLKAGSIDGTDEEPHDQGIVRALQVFTKFGKVVRCRLVVDLVTGVSKRYAFVEYESERICHRAYREANKTEIEGCEIFVDHECARTMEGWVPRRLGGGFGGKKESGQLRFGGRDRPFRKPIVIAPPNNQSTNEQHFGFGQHRHQARHHFEQN